jgi:hypothetical protein
MHRVDVLIRDRAVCLSAELHDRPRRKYTEFPTTWSRSSKLHGEIAVDILLVLMLADVFIL